MLPYDGINPLPPQFCYLKPHYLDVQTSHFDHLATRCAMSSLDRILPFLRPIEDLLRDPDGHRGDGELRRSSCVRRAQRSARSGPRSDVWKSGTSRSRSRTSRRACGDEISEVQPALDARLEDGSRVAAMFPPCSVDGPTLTVRKFTHRYTL